MLASYLNLKDQEGILVTKVDAKSPVGEAGLKKGDIIKRINNNIISNFEDAQLAVSDIGVGEKIKFHILRDNKERVIEVDAVEHKWFGDWKLYIEYWILNKLTFAMVGDKIWWFGDFGIGLSEASPQKNTYF